jgi:hypothetical protein
MSSSLIVWVKEELKSEVNGWNQGNKGGVTGLLDNKWEREGTGLKEKNKPPNSFLKLLRTVRYEPKLFSTIVILKPKNKMKTPTKLPRIFQQLLKKIRLGWRMKIGLDKGSISRIYNKGDGKFWMYKPSLMAGHNNGWTD